jgi:hypothetical protein
MLRNLPEPLLSGFLEHDFYLTPDPGAETPEDYADAFPDSS